MHKALFAILLHTAAPWLPKDDVIRHAGYIASTVNDDINLGVMLIATGTVETGYRKGWEHCDCKDAECDFGLSLGTYQLQSYWRYRFTESEVCQDTGLQTSLASKALVSMLKRYGSSHEALRMYVGRVSDSDPRVEPRFKLYDQLTRIVWERKKNQALSGISTVSPDS